MMPLPVQFAFSAIAITMEWTVLCGKIAIDAFEELQE
jgi:hypothetical protein